MGIRACAGGTRAHHGWQYWPGRSTGCVGGWHTCPRADVGRGLDGEGVRGLDDEGRPPLPGIAETSGAALVRAAGLGQVPRGYASANDLGGRWLRGKTYTRRKLGATVAL